MANLIKVRNLNLKECEIILVTVCSIASWKPINPRASCGIIREGQPFHSSVESARWLWRKACDYSDKLARYFQRRRRSVGSTALDHSRVINYRPAILPPRRSCADRGALGKRLKDRRVGEARTIHSLYAIGGLLSTLSPACRCGLCHSFVIVARMNMGHGLLLSRA